MTALEETNNGCTAAASEDAHGAGLLEGGVGKPGGFTNTESQPRAGGAVGLPGGLANTEDPRSQPAAELVGSTHREGTDDVEEDYIPRVWSPGPYSRGGRPTVLTPPIKEELCKLLSIGLSRRQAAAWLDIDHTTISRLAAKDEEFARSITRAEELAVVQPMLVLAAASRRNWKAATALLKLNRHRPSPAPTEEEKNQIMEARLADQRRNLEYKMRLTVLEEEARVEASHRKRERAKAHDRAMLAKERAEREERRRRKAEREQAQGLPPKK